MIVENMFFSKQFSYSMRLLLVFTEILIFTEIKARLLKVRKTVHSPTPTHTHPHPRKGHAHPHLTTPIIKKVTLTRTRLHLAKKVTLTHNHPNPATKRSHSPTLTHIRPRKGHAHPHPAEKRSYPPTPAHTSQKMVTLIHTQPKKVAPTHT